MPDRLAFGAAVEQLSLAHESRTSICAPFMQVLPVNAAAVCTLGAPFGSETVSASNAMAAHFDELQFDLGEGPAWAALATRRPVLVDNFATSSGATWPALMKAARNTEVHAVYTFPLIMGSVDIGAVSLFSTRSGGFTPAQILDAEVLAQIAALQVLRRSLTAQTLKTNLEDNEGYSRRVVHQATGMVLAQLNLSAADALLIIHGHAFAHGRTVREVAADVVTRRLDFSSIPESENGNMVTKTREGHFLETFVTLADTLVAVYDVVDLLHTLVEKCAALLEASAAGIILSAGDGELEVVASTNERSRLVEILQLRAGSGPCVESFTSGLAVAVPDIDSTGDKWPKFRQGALAQGFASMHAVPLRLRATTIGSLNLFWDRTGGLSTADTNTVQALADVATIGILQERAIRESDIVRQQLQHALSSRVLIEQAKGVVAYTHGVHMGDAFDKIREYARHNGLPLADVAESIVNRVLIL